MTICKEPLPVVQRFLAWHRALGADLIRIYFDDPDDPAIALVAHLPWVQAIPCTSALWFGLGLTPHSEFSMRQVAALTHGYRQSREGWVAVLDADELFYFSGRSFQDVLALQSPETRGMRVGTAEYVGAGQGVNGENLHFRLAMSKHQASVVYGADGFFFRPTGGLIGHRVGKSITRAGLKIRRMRPHWAAAGKERDLTDVSLGAADGAFLLHFINVDYAGWRAKLNWRMAASGGISPRIKAELVRILALGAESEAELAAFFSKLHRVDAAVLARLQAAGCHLALPDEFLALTRRYFPDAQPAIPAA